MPAVSGGDLNREPGLSRGVWDIDDPGWPAELRRRIDDIDSGVKKPIPWEEARKMMFGGSEEEPRAG